ncbi:MAG: hypothetical protein IPF92_29600 [Myxococcales bacterium]|nr:hypothetical protein [Myxococcales bacterium]MBL0196836.1 hypothetical protein [Myxococcales bacterium]HQY62146.1 hypothetical protein [Polyangiaceae bacterium]
MSKPERSASPPTARTVTRRAQMLAVVSVMTLAATPARANPTSPTVVVPQLDDPHHFGRPSPSGTFAVMETARGLRVRDLRRGLLGPSVSLPPDAGTPLAITDDGDTVLLSSMALFDRATSGLRKLSGERAPRQACF